MTEWIKHDGGPCPVHPETVVSVRSNTGWEEGKNIYLAGFLPWAFMTENAGFEFSIIRAHPDCPSINERAALNQAITTAMDMTRAGIAQSEPEWNVEHCQETGVDYAIRWWSVTDGKERYDTDTQASAQWLADKLNGKA